MKVSERIKELRKSLANATVDTANRYLIERQLNLLVDNVANVLQEAREQGHDNGYQAGYMEGLRMSNLSKRADDHKVMISH